MPVVKPNPPSFSRQRKAALRDYVTALAWKPDGESILVGTADGKLTLLGPNADELWSENTHDGGVLSVAWSHDGNEFASGGQDGKVKIRRSTGKSVAELEAGGPWVDQLEYNPTGLLASAAGRTLRIWKGVDSQELEPLKSSCTGLGWNPADPTSLAAASYGGVKHYRVGRMEPDHEFPWKGSLLSLYWSPDGRHIACGCQDQSVHVWITESGEDMEMTGYESKVKALSWSCTGRFLATSGAAEACLWDFGGRGPKGTTPIMLEGHKQAIAAVSFQNRGALLATTDEGGALFVWDISKPKKPISTMAMQGEALCAEWSPDDSQLAAGDAQGNLCLWETEPKALVPARPRGRGGSG
jgi:WD40 repeat protein